MILAFIVAYSACPIDFTRAHLHWSCWPQVSIPLMEMCVLSTPVVGKQKQSSRTFVSENGEGLGA